MKFEKTLLSGSNAMLILSLLSDGDKYGYEMVRELKRRSENVFELQEGTLYPLLHALEKSGDVKAYDKTTPAGRERRYYHLSEKGAQRLQEKIREWRFFSEGVNTVLGAAAPSLG
ncbi:MAG: helix-turn-helix transcriptional regulator [Lachnospiraceae bacterium]|jgi:PadR family transcriptional regulator PadR|nr:helix-turn-helix transcriptional regulator [Lachnospiraceae bacterium]